ncbi:hypothetical protein BX285_1024 [Streptomyces sp. 1114.5]|uniref:hypothetical protein n=1 Tax=Streptomyces sp. 1114.5 TaxID=1938830 RepID=UPI000F211461|nr:hypothetical protein [Streptomyces sp. 1114.5]RKT16677.1 hypothetical protein BX285_1024 [Streptomyces sp. 1114.5]
MTKDQVSRLIGGGFGLAFIQMNAATLPTAVAVPLRMLAILAFLRIVFAGRRAAVPAADADRPPSGTGFGRGYWYVVAVEALALGAGLFVISKVLHTPTASVAWIALVVGVHFFGLAAVWKRPALHVLGASMAVCGVAGLVLAACGVAAPVIAVVSGVVPGVLLLGSVLWSGRPAAAR